MFINSKVDSFPCIFNILSCLSDCKFTSFFTCQLPRFYGQMVLVFTNLGLDKIQVRTKSRFGQNIGSDKIQVWTKSRFGQNLVLDKIQVWTKSRFGQNLGMDKIQVWTKYILQMGHSLHTLQEDFRNIFNILFKTFLLNYFLQEPYVFLDFNSYFMSKKLLYELGQHFLDTQQIKS